MTPKEAIEIVNSKAQGRTRYKEQEDFLDEVLVAEIERLRNIVSTTLFYIDGTIIMFDCPRCRSPYKLNSVNPTQWCCDTCDITLHYSDTTFLEILAQVQKKYAF